MGVQPYLLSNSVAGLIAQRLVRVLCRHCKQAYQADEYEKKFLKLSIRKKTMKIGLRTMREMVSLFGKFIRVNSGCDMKDTGQINYEMARSRACMQ